MRLELWNLDSHAISTFRHPALIFQNDMTTPGESHFVGAIPAASGLCWFSSAAELTQPGRAEGEKKKSFFFGRQGGVLCVCPPPVNPGRRFTRMPFLSLLNTVWNCLFGWLELQVLLANLICRLQSSTKYRCGMQGSKATLICRHHVRGSNGGEQHRPTPNMGRAHTLPTRPSGVCL